MTNFLRKTMLLCSIILLTTFCAKAQFTFVGNFGGNGYYVSTGIDNWFQSFLKANAAGLRLVRISSDAENTFVQGTTSQVAWIGIGTGANFNGNVLDMGNYRWADSVVDPYWKFGNINGVPQPDNANGTQRCIVIHSADMSPADAWDDTEPFKEFLCVAEGPKCKADVTLSTTEVVLGCGVGLQNAILTVTTPVTGATITWTGTGAGFLSSTTGSPVTFTPTMAGTFGFTATVANAVTGCTTSVSKNIKVIDIFERDICGKKTGKVIICHTPPKNNQTKAVPISALGGHLGHGDYCGPCREDCNDHDDDCDCGQCRNRHARIVNTGGDAVIKVYPNPTNSVFHIEVPFASKVTITDLQGRVIETKEIESSDEFNLENRPTGMYIVEIDNGVEKYHTKIVRQ